MRGARRRRKRLSTADFMRLSWQFDAIANAKVTWQAVARAGTEAQELQARDGFAKSELHFQACPQWRGQAKLEFERQKAEEAGRVVASLLSVPEALTSAIAEAKQLQAPPGSEVAAVSTRDLLRCGGEKLLGGVCVRVVAHPS